MLTPYNPISSGLFLTGPKAKNNQVPSQAASAFDIGSTAGSAPLFQSNALGLSNSSYPLATGSAFDTTTQPPQLQELLAMICQLLEQLIEGLQSKPSAAQKDVASFDQTDTTGNSVPTKGDKAPAKQSQPKDQSNQPSTDPNKVKNSTGWNKNVNVFASSSPTEETWGGRFLDNLEKGADQGKTLTQSFDDAPKLGGNKQTPIRNQASENSLVKGKGGKAVIVTGDNYDSTGGGDADKLATTLKKDYGMDVTVIHDASPKQLKEALQKMGQDKGEQCMVAVLGHGAKDDSGKNNGTIALGKKDGNQWLSEADLKSEVNEYLSPNYDNVNVVFNSCFSGNFVE